nr:hypothetical protein [Peribacillus alkalitolerans]
METAINEFGREKVSGTTHGQIILFCSCVVPDTIYWKRKDRNHQCGRVYFQTYRHIPDEQFKTIRHYGVYSRRSKKLCKKILAEWYQKAKRWIVKVKKKLHRQTWRERILASSKKYEKYSSSFILLV